MKAGCYSQTFKQLTAQGVWGARSTLLSDDDDPPGGLDSRVFDGPLSRRSGTAAVRTATTGGRARARRKAPQTRALRRGEQSNVRQDKTPPPPEGISSSLRLALRCTTGAWFRGVVGTTMLPFEEAADGRGPGLYSSLSFSFALGCTSPVCRETETRSKGGGVATSTPEESVHSASQGWGSG